MLVEQAEKIYFEAYRLQGAEWADEEPLWLTWSLLRFGEYPPRSRLVEAALQPHRSCIFWDFFIGPYGPACRLSS